MALAMIFGCGGDAELSMGGRVEPIGGNIEATDFVIPAGDTRLVTSDLTIHATNSIQIDGVLKVPPGTDFKLFSDGDLVINGKIEPDKTTAASGRAATDDGGSSGDGKTVTVKGEIHMGEGKGFSLCASGPDNKLVITGQITGGRGKESTELGAEGGRGSSVEIGTTKAVDKAHADGRTRDQGFDEIEIWASAELRGGTGGRGFSDEKGSVSGNLLVGSCSDGGKGGDVNVSCNGRLTFDGVAQGGAGGDGGLIPSTFTKGQNGDAPGVKGQSVEVKTGNGGAGGTCNFSGNPLAGTGKRYGGQGAYGGHASVTAGNGGPGAPGGDVTVIVGRKGDNGAGLVSPDAELGRPEIVLEGGRGGDGQIPDTKGGDGGKATIRQFAGGTAPVKLVSLHEYGHGGEGASGCIEQPFQLGAPGGDALPPTNETDKAPDISGLVGGNGGSGNPAGPGGHGPAGNGADGSPCSELELVVIIDEDLGKLPKSSIVPVAWFEGGHLGRPEYPVSADHGCDRYHYHGNSDQVFVWDKRDPAHPVKYGPFADPNKTHCGFGKVYLRRKKSSAGMVADADSICCSR